MLTSVGRIALVLASSTGGTGRHVASLAQGLVAAGNQVTVLAGPSAEARFGFTRVGARLVVVEIPANPQPGDIRAVRALRRELAQPGDGRKFDVVHAHGLRAGLAADLARPAGLPLVVTWHNLVLAHGVRGMLSRVLERRVARRADRTLCVSPDLVTRAERLGAQRVELAVVPAPPLVAPIRSREETRAQLLGTEGVAQGRPLVVAVGRLHPQKGFDVLISAAARWRDRCPVPLVAIAGAGPAQADLEARIAATGAPVTLLGHRTDIADVLAAADLVVATSIWEGQPLLVQEVLRAGVPLVTTSVGGIPQIVGQAAMLVAVGDVDAVDRAVRELLDDPGALAEYARRGPLRAAGWPGEADSIAQVTRVYGELLAEAAG